MAGRTTLFSYRALAAPAAMIVLLLAGAAAMGDSQAVTDGKNDVPGLKQRPELDIVRAGAGHGVAGKLKHKVTMRGKLTPGKKFTRPFILINTKGGSSSAFEYLVLGKRVFEANKDGDLQKAGAAKFQARKRTWVYRFKEKTIGNPKSYGWAALTAKGNVRDLAPNAEYKQHDLVAREASP